MEYWRKKASEEEKAAMRRAGMMLVLFANGIESMNSAFGCKAIKTKGLSDEIEASIGAGEFDTCIKSIAITPGAIAVLNNPVASFATTFGSIVLSTHMKNLKKEAANGIDTLKSQDVKNNIRPNSVKTRKSMLDSSAPLTSFSSVQDHAATITPILSGLAALANI